MELVKVFNFFLPYCYWYSPLIDVWYNTINNVEQNEKTWPLAELCANKKLKKHSARKITVWKLKSFGFPKCEIKNITGHSSECGLDAYNSGNEDEMFAMSSAMYKSKYSTSTLAQKNFQLSPSPEQSKRDFCRTIHPTPINNNVSFGLNWNDFSQSQLSKPFGTCSSGIFSFNACQVNVNINNSMQPQQNNNATKHKIWLIFFNIFFQLLLTRFY